MKQYVSGHAVALNTPIMVKNLMGEDVEVQFYEHQNGGVFAMDGSFLEQVAGDYIPDPFNEGHSVQLVDHLCEIREADTTGEEDDELIDKVIDDLREAFRVDDYTTLAELLSYVPDHVLKNHLDM